jgi:MraZ protein
MPDAISNPRLYTGRNRVVLDPKHRITVPAGWREKSGEPEKFFLRPAHNRKHIDILPPAIFYQIYNDIENDQTISHQERRAFARDYYQNVEECHTDRQGRLVVPDEFCELAGLQGELLLLGVGPSIEIWEPERLRIAVAEEKEASRKVADLRGL